jgi:hypothetical protein
MTKHIGWNDRTLLFWFNDPEFLPLLLVLLLLLGPALAAFPAVVFPMRVLAGTARLACPSVVGVRSTSQVLEKAVGSDGTLFATRLA